MSTQIFKLVPLALILAGCEIKIEEPDAADQQAATGARTSQSDAESAQTSDIGGETIRCALAGSTQYTQICSVERVIVGDTLELVVQHPNGGFRRFEVQTDGTGLAAADGADEAEITIREDRMIEARIDTDTYLFPATIGTTESNGGA